MTNETAGTAAPARPAPPAEAPRDGLHWEAREADPKVWRASDGGTCRWRGSGDEHACGGPAVIERRRGVKRVIWWRYDQQHAYGRWVEERAGQKVVMEYAAVLGEEEPT